MKKVKDTVANLIKCVASKKACSHTIKRQVEDFLLWQEHVISLYNQPLRSGFRKQ